MGTVYPNFIGPRFDKPAKKWVLTIERAAGDLVSVDFLNRIEARAKKRELMAAARLVLPKENPKGTGDALPPPPRSLSEATAFIGEAVKRATAGELPYNVVQPVIQLVKLQMKLFEMADPEEMKLQEMTESELLDLIFAQLTTEELLELCRERLDAREAELRAA